MSEFDDLVAVIDPALVVVTVAVGEERDGCLVGFHSQASIEPRFYAVWLSKANRTWRLAQRAEHLAVHLLADDQHDLAGLFGGHTGDDVDKLARTTWVAGPGGVPLLAACPNRFVARIEQRLDAGGDHVCVIADPISVTSPGLAAPLRLRDASDIEPGHPA